MGLLIFCSGIGQSSAKASFIWTPLCARAAAGSSCSPTRTREIRFADDLILVDLGKMHDLAKLLAENLRNTLEVPVQVKGSILQVGVEHNRDVKQTVQKFLHHNGLDHYRIVAGSNNLTVMPPKKPHRLPSEETGALGSGISPFSPYRMNPISSVEFPNYPPLPARKYKSRRKR